MTRDNKRDKKIQGFTTTQVLYGLNQIEIAENKKQSEVLHDAVISYVRNHPDVQISVKRQISIQNLSEKMHVLREISSNLNEFSTFEANYVAFCVDLSVLKGNENKKLPLIEDLKQLLLGVKKYHSGEYEKYVKIAHKLLNKKTFNLVFPEPIIKSSEIMKAEEKQRRDKKEMSIGEYREAYKNPIIR